MYGKIVIRSKLKVLTGLHIGGSDAFSAIGAVDSPVIRDSMSNNPIIPGSSLKGKLRTLLVRSLAEDITKMPEHNGDDNTIKRLFGSSSKPIVKSRLQFADAFLANSDEFSGMRRVTEVKFENTINRNNCVANPRQIERVVRGAEFSCCIVYDIENKEEVDEDLKNLAKAMRLLQLDYLGGHGTRGSGRVSFQAFNLDLVESSAGIELEEIREIFKEVEDYELLSL